MVVVTDSTADYVIESQGRMEAERSNWDPHYQEIAERIWPRANYFNRSGHQTEGEKRTEKQFDATASLALERFAAAMESMLTPRTQLWHAMKALDENLNERSNVRKYLERLNKFLWQKRYSGRTNFASNAHETYMSLGAFGTGAIAVQDLLNQRDANGRLGVSYRALHLSECFIDENWHGEIDRFHRKWMWKARQFAQRFGEKNLPEKIKTALAKNADQQFEIIHCVKPNEERIPSKRDARGMAFASYFVVPEGRVTLERGGFRVFPYGVSRYVTGPRERYGRSPAMTVLPDIKMLNEMNKTVMRAAHRVVDPPLLLSDDGGLQAMNTRPGGLNWGGIDSQGRELVKPLITQARVDIGEELMEQKRQVIQEAFLVTLFQILVDAPQMTATEALIRAQEKGALLAPAMGRQQSELLSRIIQREIDIYASAGVEEVVDMPDELRDAGGQIEIEYVSPLNRAQRAEEGVAILRTLESLVPLAQIKPHVLDVFKEVDTARELAEINGVPLKLLRTKEEMEDIEEKGAQADEAAALLAAAPVVGKTVKDMAQAQQAAQTTAF